MSNTCQPGTGCTGAHHPDHKGHDQWHLISSPGFIWCRTCQVDYKMSIENKHQHRWGSPFLINGMEAQRCFRDQCPAVRVLLVDGVGWLRVDGLQEPAEG